MTPSRGMLVPARLPAHRPRSRPTPPIDIGIEPRPTYTVRVEWMNKVPIAT